MKKRRFKTRKDLKIIQGLNHKVTSLIPLNILSFRKRISKIDYSNPPIEFQVKKIKKNKKFYLFGSMMTLMDSLASDTSLKPVPMSFMGKRCVIIFSRGSRLVPMSWMAVRASVGAHP